MGDRITTTAKLVAEFDGTFESAEEILEKVQAIRREIRQQIAALTKEINAITALTEYILEKRNELAHDKKVKVSIPGWIMLENKQERVEAVLEAAIAVAQDDIPIFSTQDIERQLEKDRIDLNVSYPSAVIATILTADKRFKKNENGSYEYNETPKKRRRKK